MDFITQSFYFIGYIIFEFPNVILAVLVIALFIANSNRKAAINYVANNHAGCIKALAHIVDRNHAEHNRKESQLWERITELETQLNANTHP